MTAMIVALQALTGQLRSDRGQSSVEYLGIVIVAAVLVAVLITAATGWGEQIREAISRTISDLSG